MYTSYQNNMSYITSNFKVLHLKHLIQCTAFISLSLHLKKKIEEKKGNECEIAFHSPGCFHLLLQFDEKFMVH